MECVLPNQTILSLSKNPKHSLKWGSAPPITLASEFIYSLAAKSAKWALLLSWSLLPGGKSTRDCMAQSKGDSPLLCFTARALSSAVFLSLAGLPRKNVNKI